MKLESFTEETMNLRFAVIFGNRGFFPGELVSFAREEMALAIQKSGSEPLLMDSSLTHFGAIESLQDAYLFHDFLKKEQPDGIVVCLPNFGDETAISVACKDANVPILVHAYPDKEGEMDPSHRRDAFCGKLSLMNVMYQYQIPFTSGKTHVIHPLHPQFIQELQDFAGICRVVKGMRKCRLGAIGARTSAFKTVRYDELALQKVGITVETVDLGEVIERVRQISSDNKEVGVKLKEIKAYTDCSNVPLEPLYAMSKLSIVLDRYIEELDLDILAIRCWNELETQLGCAPCTIMSILGEKKNIQIACEMDVTNAIMMRCLALAADAPSSLLDWNNNYREESDKCILFHCGPVPVSMQTDSGRMVEHPMFAKSYGKGCGWGPIEGKLKSGEVTLASAKTEDGKLCSYIFDAQITEEKVENDFFGVYGVAEIKNLQQKLSFFGQHCFRHHVAITNKPVAAIMKEAITKYLGYTYVDLP
jgi:L-fucose isomerase-like protein